ncbi:MAG: iron ABC transporter permease [Actinomycetia bacterium]|nr:iron ABC transporter permease [Actinomycetes bacterium]
MRPPTAFTHPVVVVGSALVGAAFALPLAYVVWRNVTEGGDLGAELTSARTLEPLIRSLVLAVATALATSVIGTTLAWLTIRTDIPVRRLWQVLAPLPLVFPSFVGAAALLASLAPGGLLDELLSPLGVNELPRVEGFVGATLVLTLFTYPYVYLPVAARLRGLPPSLEESARVLGRGPWSTFRTIVLPQILDPIRAGAVLVFLYALSDFGAVALMRYDTLTRSIYANYQGLRLSRAFTLALILALLAIVVAATERRIGAPVDGGRAGRPPNEVALGRWRWPAVLVVFTVVANALIGPVAALTHWAGRGIVRDEDPWGRLGDEMGQLVSPAITTILLGLATAAIAVAVLLPVAWLTRRWRSPFTSVINALVVAGFALPGLAIALSVVFWSLQSPLSGLLYQSWPVLVFAYVVHFGAQALRTGQVAVDGVPNRISEAGATLGASRFRRLLTLELPLMTPGLLAGGGLVLLSTMKELPATLLARPIGAETLATEVWGAWEEGFLTEVGLSALLLLALSGILTWFLIVRRADAFD